MNSFKNLISKIQEKTREKYKIEESNSCSTTYTTMNSDRDHIEIPMKKINAQKNSQNINDSALLVVNRE